jgi:hypothetical protein
MAADEESLKPVDPIDWYDANADEPVALYESVLAAEVHGGIFLPMVNFISRAPETRWADNQPVS